MPKRGLVKIGLIVSTIISLGVLIGYFSQYGVSAHNFNRYSIKRIPPHKAEVKSGQTLDLLTNQSWSLAGVKTNSDDSLYVSYEGMSIVHQDGSAGKDNPAVNLFGTHLSVSGDFSLTATMDFSNYNGEGAITLYGSPPIIYDEQRYDSRTLRVALHQGSLSVGLINGDQSQSLAVQKTYAFNQGKLTTINIMRQNNHLIFGIVTGKDTNGKNIIQSLGTITYTNLLDSGQLWFGLDSGSTGGGWTLKSATLEPINAGHAQIIDFSILSVTPKDPQGLNALAAKKRPGFKIGTAVALGPLVGDAAYTKLILGGNFGLVTTENALKFQFVHPQLTHYAFEEADALVAIAQKNDITVHGHALDFSEANPTWVQDIAKKNPEQLQGVLEDHIKTVVGHFGNKVNDWDVVNEPLADYGTASGQYGLRRSIWYQAMGPDHIAIALRAAHAANPQARLWINDYGLESDDSRFATMLSLVQRLKAEGVPLYGIGFEAHIDNGDTINNDTTINKEQLRQHIRSLAALGIKARISELDVTNETEQAVFADVLGVCISEPNCTDMTMWGATDKYSSSGGINDQGQLETGTGLPWDTQIHPLPSVQSMKKALLQFY